MGPAPTPPPTQGGSAVAAAPLAVVVLPAAAAAPAPAGTVATDAAGWPVSVVSPARARLRRAKTDAGDAAGLAAYGRARQPAPWTPPPADVPALPLRRRQRDALAARRPQARNRPPGARCPRCPPRRRRRWRRGWRRWRPTWRGWRRSRAAGC